MSAATVVAGSQFRRTWRPLLVLGVLVALASGLAMAGIAGARRTASVLGRAALSALAEAYGTATEPVVSVGALALVAVVVVALASGAGWLPAARTLRRSPADILRTE
jgi:ABC-type antimicrobial peptide transport system permease subunit